MASPPAKGHVANYEDLMESMFGAESGTSGAPDLSREAFAKDAQKLNARFKAMNKGLVDPTSKFMSYWDLAIMASMLFTVFVTPFELSLVRNPSVGVLFVVNQFVNVVFIVDIVLQFFLPFKTSVKDGGRTIRTHSIIARTYLRGFFAIDLLSVLPLDVVDVAGGFKAMVGDGNESSIKMIRLLRLLKLLKLTRIFKSSRLISRWESRIAWTYTTKQGLFYILLIIVTLHWLACAWACLAQFHLGNRSDELAAAVAASTYVNGDGSACEGCTGPGDQSAVCRQDCLTECEVYEFSKLRSVSIAYVLNQEHWICRSKEYGTVTGDWENVWELWVTCMIVAIGQLNGGSFNYNPQNVGENILFFVALLIGSVIWAIVQGVVCGIITTGGPAA